MSLLGIILLIAVVAFVLYGLWYGLTGRTYPSGGGR